MRPPVAACAAAGAALDMTAPVELRLSLQGTAWVVAGSAAGAALPLSCAYSSALAANWPMRDSAGTVSPAATRIWNQPATGASTSYTTFSVSTCISGAPRSTCWPSVTSHSRMVPSFMPIASFGIT